ncbi:MAG: O-antigen ligase family protein [Lacibacter sp.]
MVIIISLACILTFSKTLVLIFWGVGVILFNKYYKLTKFILFISLIPVVVFLFFTTHFVFVKPQSEQYDRYLKTNFVSSSVAFKAGETEALETCYFLNKKIAIEVFFQHPLLGIGAGNFNDELEKRKTENKYPANFLSYDPHSTYLGALAENGLLGFISVLLILVKLLSWYWNIDLLRRDYFYQSLFILLVIFSVEAISTDIMNFRHLWVLIAIAFSYHHFRETQ